MIKVFFFIRLFIFFLLALLPLLHPSLAIFADAGYIWFFFVVLPLSSIAPFFYTKKRKTIILFFFSLMILISIFIEASFFGLLILLLTAVLICMYTIITFRFGFYAILCFEPLILLYYLYRFSDTLRSSSFVSEQGSTIILFLSVFGFAVWTGGIFFICYLQNKKLQFKKKKSFSKSTALFSFCFLLGIATAIYFFPTDISDYIYRIPQNKEVIKNPSSDADGRIRNNNNSVNGISENGKKGKARLLESSDESWQGISNSQGSSQNRYLLMIVASEAKSLYMAKSYSPILDPINGFIVDANFFLNALSGVHFLETWRNPDVHEELFRENISVTVFTSLRETYVPWLPLSIEPTVYSEKNRPLSFHYEASSLLSTFDENSVVQESLELSVTEKEMYVEELSLPFDEKTIDLFRSYLHTIITAEDSYQQRIQKIIESFAHFTYEESDRDFIGINEMKEFLFETQTGDCSEFSATAALLGRLAGIPSRVVTGYAITKDMQTEEDRHAIRVLQERFPPIKDIPLEFLNLITTSESHAWPQFYIPSAGWVDFEPTQYAQVESLASLSRSNDLVIPLFSSKESENRNLRKILLSIVLVFTVLTLLLIMYMQCRYWIFLVRCILQSNKKDSLGIKAAFHLFLLSLRSRKYAYKKDSQTPFEYACMYPVLQRYIVLYERALYHPNEAIRKTSDTSFRKETALFFSQTRSFFSMVRLFFGWSLWRYVKWY